MEISTPQTLEPVIRVEHLFKSFEKVEAVSDLSFDVKQGEIFGFLGPSGAGKTTTLSVLEGLLKADQRQVHILGLEIGTHTKQIKSQIGVQLQSTSLLPDLNVFEQVQMFACLYGYQPAPAEILSLLG